MDSVRAETSSRTAQDIPQPHPFATPRDSNATCVAATLPSFEEFLDYAYPADDPALKVVAPMKAGMFVYQLFGRSRMWCLRMWSLIRIVM